MSDLVRLAILGTGQAAGDAQTGTDADALVDALELEAREAVRERALLLRAGAAAVLRRAGTRAIAWTAPIARAGVETRRRAGPSLASMVASMLDGNEKELLPEALESMADAGLRLPEELLPKALDEQEPSVRERLLPVLGARGLWLAEQELEPTWAWARATSDAPSPTLPANADDAWMEGSTLERELLLTFARKLEPARGRAWVESSFKSDKPEQRRRWLELLEIGLSMADAPFIEAALGDRSSVVRIRAARALWLLPETRVAKDVGARVDAAVGADLTIALPEEPFDAALERLGLVESPPQGVGKRQWWLAQLLSAVSPQRVAERTHKTPRELVALAAQHELREVLLEGFTAGALRFEADAWLAPLWDAWSRDEGPRGWITARPLDATTERLLAANRLEELEPRLLRAVREARHVGLLSLLPRPWPPSIAEACIAQVRARSQAFVWCLPLIAARIPIALAPLDLEPVANAGGRRDAITQAFERFRTLIDLRHQLSREIEAHRAAGSAKGT